jgi:hypothetical protein
MNDDRLALVGATIKAVGHTDRGELALLLDDGRTVVIRAESMETHEVNVQIEPSAK